MKDTTPLYLQTAEYAVDHNELELYRKSNQANYACKKLMEESINEHYKDYCLNSDCIRKPIEQYGVDRVSFVCAMTVRMLSHDGRIDTKNRAWCDSLPMVKDYDGFGFERKSDCAMYRTHPGLVDCFINILRREIEQKRESVKDKLASAPKQKRELPIKAAPQKTKGQAIE